MSFGGEYLLPEAWRKINDTPVDGTLSKTEKIKRGQVQFHQKSYPKDDWKFCDQTVRVGTVFKSMEKVRTEPFSAGSDAHLGADAPSFKQRARTEFTENRQAAARNRVPNVCDSRRLPETSAFHQAGGWDKPAGGGASAAAPDRPAAGVRSGGVGSIPVNASERRRNASHFLAGSERTHAAAAETYNMAREAQRTNRYQNDTPSWSRPEWMMQPK